MNAIVILVATIIVIATAAISYHLVRQSEIRRVEAVKMVNELARALANGARGKMIFGRMNTPTKGSSTQTRLQVFPDTTTRSRSVLCVSVEEVNGDVCTRASIIRNGRTFS